MHNYQELPTDVSRQKTPAVDSNAVSMAPSLYLVSLWAARKFIIFMTATTFLLGCLYIFVKPANYIATAVIAPPSSAGSSSSGGLSSALSAVAGLGVSFGASNSVSFDKYAQVLRSTRLAEKLAQEDGVMEHLFNVEWDGDTQTWQPPAGSFAAWKQSVKRALGIPVNPVTPEQITTTLNQILSLGYAPSTGGLTAALRSQITVVTLTYGDRNFAVTLLNYVLRDADEIIRQDQLTNVSNRINYLDRMLKKTTDVNLSNSLSQIMMDQERNLMILNADKYYSIDMIDPPYADPKPSGISPVMILAMSIIFGLFISLAAVFLILRQRVIAAAETGIHPLARPFPDPFKMAKWRRSFRK